MTRFPPTTSPGRRPPAAGRPPRQTPPASFAGAAAAVLAILSATVLVAAEPPGEPPPPSESAVAALRAELAALRSDYEERIGALEQRIAELESGGSPAAEAPARPAAGAEDDLAALRSAARELAAATSGGAGEEKPPPAGPAVGRERNLNRLNPEISMTGNVLAVTSDDSREEFRVQEFELDLQSALDPFSATRWTLAVSEEGVEIEEGYVVYPSLWRGVGVTAGRFRQRFGPLNRHHLHALPQVEYPLALQAYFGEEGLGQTGLSFAWPVPPRAAPWADATELVFEVTDGSSEAFGGEDFERLVYLGRAKSFWDLSPSTYLELGFSGISGGDGAGGTSRVVGADLTFDWAPPGRSKYREVLWRTEVMRSERDDLLGNEREAWGGYSYLQGLLRRNLWAGVRYDRVEDPLAPELVREAVVPYLTWWQSEYVRLRGEYRFFDDDAGELEDGLVLQLTWAAGPHKHEGY